MNIYIYLRDYKSLSCQTCYQYALLIHTGLELDHDPVLKNKNDLKMNFTNNFYSLWLASRISWDISIYIP